MNVHIHSDAPVSPTPDHAEGRCCAYPLTTLLPGGDLLVAYRRGTGKHSHDGVFVTQTSTDNGMSWAAPAAVFDQVAATPPQTPVTGGFVGLGDGRGLGVMSTIEGLTPGVYMFDADSLKLPRHTMVCRSEDGGANWLPIEELRVPGFPRIGITARPIQCANGNVALFFEYRTDTGTQATAVMLSDDGGRTFDSPTVVAADPTGNVSLCDGRAVLLPDGRLYMALWTFRRDNEVTVDVHATWSEDHGRTWTPPIETGLIGQITAPVALPDGTLLAAANVRTPPHDGIQLWRSNNDGRTWEQDSRVLMWSADDEAIVGTPLPSPAVVAEQGGVWAELQRFTFGTPDLNLLANGDLLLTYYAAIGDSTRVRACRFTIA